MNDTPNTAVAVRQESQALGFLESAAKTFEGIERIAALMAKMGTMPAHVQSKPADCFRIVVQAAKWGMDPFAVAECTALVHGRLCYEGKLVAAVLHVTGAIEGRLEYDIQGKGQAASITITGTPRGGKPQILRGTVQEWKTTHNGSPWEKQPETMLVYRGTRQWARLYAPEALLGVYTPDEIEEPRTVEATIHDDPKPAKVRDSGVGSAINEIAAQQSAARAAEKEANDPDKSQPTKTLGEHVADAQAKRDASAEVCVDSYAKLWNGGDPARALAKSIRSAWNLAQIADLGKDTEDNRAKFLDDIATAWKSLGGGK